jgi:hypothetical protein
MTNNNNENIFAKGVLVKLETSCWTGRARIPSRVLLSGSNHADVDPRFVGAHKRLVDGATLKAVETVRGEARAWLYAQSLPFPLEGVVFVPTAQISAVDAKLAEFAAAFKTAADTFAADFAALRDTARTNLGSLYSDADYPADVRRRFAFGWRFLSLAPAGETQLLDPALVQREREKFSALMAEAAEQAVTALRVRFAETIDRMVDRLSGEREGGKARIFRDSLVTNLHEFLDAFQVLNISDDKALAALVEKARLATAGVEAADLRSDENLRAHVASQMTTVQDAIDGMLVDRPTRKLRFGAVPEAEVDAA